MFDQTKQEIKDVMDTHRPNQRLFHQKFEYKDNTIEHQNKIQIQKTEQSSQQLQIKNYFASAEGDKVIKVTEVRIGDKIIKIVDCFHSTFHSRQTKSLIQKAKIQEPVPLARIRKNILDKYSKISSSLDLTEEPKVRDTKNVVKNIYKLFQSWALKSAPVELRVQLKEGLQLLFHEQEKFNNSLIISLSKNAMLRKAFITFCESKAEVMIEQSRIKDKESHSQALRKYCQICNDEQLEQIYLQGQGFRKEKQSEVKN